MNSFIKTCRTAIGCLVIFGGAMIGCHSNEDKTKICVPVSVYGVSDSTVFVYASDNHLTEMLHYQTKRLYQRDVVTYSNGRITKYEQMNVSGNGTYSNGPHYLFTYGAGANPTIRTSFSSTADPDGTVLYAYDGKNRLLRKDFVSGSDTLQSIRYEYGDNDNVSKIYYVQSSGRAEIRGVEFLAYDNYPTYFAGSKDLVMVQTLVYGNTPSMHNVLAETIHAGLNSPASAPRNLEFALTYNATGYVIAFTLPVTEAVYDSVSYACK